MAEPRCDIELRRLPYPYRAMLAICSDLDETPDRQVYWETMRFLNTLDTTAMGPGVGLEVGNTIYFDMPPNQFAYWNTDDAGRAMIRTLIHSGHIDCLHSFGDLASTRSDAGRALDELDRQGCRLEVWIDHGRAATNFGADIMEGHGDEPGHEAYHADLTVGQGVRYVWRGRVTSVIGQDIRARLGGVFAAGHPLASAKTVAKEAAKQALARVGDGKYSMHAGNRVLRPSRLRDGRPVYEFIRSNPHWGGISSCERADGIGRVLTENMLAQLVRREAACVLYTHLGKVHGYSRPLPPSAVNAFQRLTDAHRAGDVLVLTTKRLLQYLAVRDAVKWSARRSDGSLVVDVRLDDSNGLLGERICPNDLSGLTFYVPAGIRCGMQVNATGVDNLRANPPDHTGRPSVSVPVTKLAFPDQQAWA